METQNLYENIEVPEDLEARLESFIDNLAEAEKKAKRKAIKIKLFISGIAASILLGLFTLSFLYTGKNTELQYCEWKPNIIEDPEIAYAETMKALVLFSNNLNKGFNSLEMVSDEMIKSNERINNKLNKTLKK